ncbi:MAG: thioredoxin domain-containing protein [Proteobacteria bacterium]|nr:thioredoxin domain-containing protein [Pseudomonadota bacterium]
MNRLANEKSAYLQHASHQKIDWYPWSEEAFERAEKENKPVFLSSGAIWCHWCHVMARECFEDDEVAKLLNEYFIPVKLDRDQRPDIDRRYQQALAAMGVSGGWPLSMFLTHDKKPFYGGTYFPPDESFGRPGFKAILLAISRLYREKKDEAIGYGEKYIEFLKNQVTVSGEGFDKSMLDEAEEKMLSGMDRLHGGFGSAPKFAMSGALEFLIHRYSFRKDEALGNAIKKTLTSMADGGIHDQLGGGFHRYSTDMTWTIPHFEKMADDNAWFLRNYIDAYCTFGDNYFKEVAEGIIAFLRRELSHPDGGFYASQDADVTPDDEGGYFLWRDEAFKSLLTDEEYKVLSLYFLHQQGAMRHDASKMVLHIAQGTGELAKQLDMAEKEVKEILLSGKQRLLKEREKRQKPIIDRAMYTSLNGMLISAFLKAYRALGDESVKEFAIMSLNRISKANVLDGKLFHSEGVEAFLDDYVNFIDALISAYEVSGDKNYLDQADLYMGQCVGKFRDKKDGGFFDTEGEVIGMRLKGVEDTPHPSANSTGIMCLIKLSLMLGRDEYMRYAESALTHFALVARAIGIHGGYYFCALNAYFHMMKLDVHALQL